MVQWTSLISIALLVSSALALPADATTGTHELDDRAPAAGFRCVNNAIAGGAFTITQAGAVAALNHSPRTTGKSGYPHTFSNFGMIRWTVDRCNTAALLEFPVLRDGRLYNADSRPKDDPGPARIIFTIEGQPGTTKLLCGVVSHVGANGNPNAGNLEQCT